MKVKVMVEVAHQGKTHRKMKTIEVPEKTVKLHGMLAEDVDDLRQRVADDIVSQVVSSVKGPAAQQLDPMSVSKGPPKPGAAQSPVDKQMAETLGLDLLEHMDKTDVPGGGGSYPGAGMRGGPAAPRGGGLPR